MGQLDLKTILEVTKGTVITGTIDKEINNFSIDTRTIQPKDIYIGIKGEVNDGNLFYKEAFAKGASACLLDYIDKDKIPLEYQDKTIILVKDTLTALGTLAAYKRSLYNIPVIAITGSVGKTSTKDLIASVVSQKYKTHKTIGNFNNHIGVPLTILSLDQEEALVIELGMNHFHELTYLSEIVKPTIVVFTNVGTAHIENLGSRENILKAKLEILDGMIGKTIVLNYDNDLLRQVTPKLEEKYQVVTTGIDNQAAYQAVNVKDNIFSSTFDILNETCGVEIKVGSKAFVSNALLAYAVGKVLGIKEPGIKKGILDFKLSPHRLEVNISKTGFTIIDDTYNANFDSMVLAITLLGKIKGRRKIALLGDMLELGDYSKELHQKLGNVVLDNNIDVLITIGNFSKEIADKVKGDIVTYSFSREEESHSLLKEILTKNDTILLKASHGINLEKTVNYLLNL